MVPELYGVVTIEDALRVFDRAERFPKTATIKQVEANYGIAINCDFRLARYAKAFVFKAFRTCTAEQLIPSKAQAVEKHIAYMEEIRAGGDRDGLAIVMPYFIASETVLLKLINHVSIALNHLHSKNVFHMDVKPNNY
ncbi:hypothetical protein HDU76_004260 [Blyttiomyces sp. JEL0837]|nr:hypothetical protein HDU76_004260 [Blyttiomyces sp. JEL0837]